MMGNKGMGFPTHGVENQGWKLYIASLIMICTAGLFVIARCASRYLMNKLGWDDAAIVASLLFSIVVSVCMQLAVQSGYGMHKTDLLKEELRTALQLFFIAQTPYKVTVCLNKVAALLLYLRLFVAKTFRTACFVIMGIIVAWSISAVCATIFQCIPIEGAWNKSLDAKCIDSNKFWIAYAVMNIITDIMVLGLPIPSIMRLQMSMRDKLMLCGVFLLGSFVTITSILRTTSVQNSLKNKEDITYNFIYRGIWTLAEANLGIISTCLPALKQPLAKIFPRIFGSSRKTSAYKASGEGYGNSHGYALSNVAASASSHPGFWRGGPSNLQTSAICSPEVSANRKSDERHIISDESLEGSDHGSEVGSHGLSMDKGILRRVDIVRTSFHDRSR